MASRSLTLSSSLGALRRLLRSIAGDNAARSHGKHTSGRHANSDRRLAGRRRPVSATKLTAGSRVNMRRLSYLVPTILAVAAVGAVFAVRSHSEASTTLQALAGDAHFHGIAVDPTHPSRVYLATHHGLYAVASDGTAKRLSPVQDFMGSRRTRPTPQAFTQAGTRRAAAISVSSLRPTAASRGNSCLRGSADRSTFTRWM
jgi:hypothetical protein